MITKQTKVFGISSALFFIFACVGIFMMVRYIQSEGKKLEQQTKEIADFTTREQTYRGLENLINTTEEQRNELRSYVLTEEKTVDFLAVVEQTAMEHGVDLTTNSLNVTEGKGLFDTLVISYSVEGTKENVDTLLLILETLPYRASISNISLQYNTETGVPHAQGLIELTVSLLRYDR